MTVHFSKTEKQPDGSWVLTVPNKGMQKTESGNFAYVPQEGDLIADYESGIIVHSAIVRGDKMDITGKTTGTGIPCVGREYVILNR